MRYFNPATDSRDSILDHYTGVGEVLAIHELDRVFTLMRHDIRVKRGRLLSLDDLKSTDLIFVGSPTENLTPPRDRDYAGVRLPDRNLRTPKRRPCDHQSQSPHRRGSTYFASQECSDRRGLCPHRGVSRDYPPLRVMILAGTTTIGTQAAVEFVCRETEARKLVAQAGVGKTGEVFPFEAVIHVKVSRGVPVAALGRAPPPRAP